MKGLKEEKGCKKRGYQVTHESSVRKGTLAISFYHPIVLIRSTNILILQYPNGEKNKVKVS